ncbi:MAG: RecX family transcriptional regulator [Chloroflexota bacterium]|nr:RecX family transcriptional regulator [Chloroflexota bacterium]
MIITAIDRAPKRRGRMQVHLDGVSKFELSVATARKYELKRGGELSAAQAEGIVAADARHAALTAAAAMLARRPHSEREVRVRLRRRGCEPDVVDETIRKLTSARLLDDAEYAQAWTESRDRISPRGRRLIEQELRANGVAIAIAQEAAEQISDSEAAMRAASRRLSAMRGLDCETFRKRLGPFLQRRGFDWETCSGTVERCWQELHNEVPADDRDA